ncbi:hypothetical protein LAV82_23050 [Bacillus sp. ILBB4]|nr:hypothetical protein [Bacillus sp. ILBB4]
MNKNQNEKEHYTDNILQAFQQTKGEQLDLLDDGFTPQNEPQTKHEQRTHEQEVTPKVEEVQEQELQQQEVIYTGYDGVQYTEEEWVSPVVRNGPSRQEVEEWKERHEGHVYFTPFDGDVFVWRVLTRPEYREIIGDKTLTALDREEYFTEKCVLFPRNFSIEKIKKSRAGIASLLSEMIMDKSGFVANSAPIKL